MTWCALKALLNYRTRLNSLLCVLQTEWLRKIQPLFLYLQLVSQNIYLRDYSATKTIITIITAKWSPRSVIGRCLIIIVCVCSIPNEHHNSHLNSPEMTNPHHRLPKHFNPRQNAQIKHIHTQIRQFIRIEMMAIIRFRYFGPRWKRIISNREPHRSFTHP